MASVQHLARRLVTVPGVLLFWGLSLLSFPLLLLLALLRDGLRASRGHGLATTRLLLVLLSVLSAEVFTLFLMAGLFLLSIGSKRRRERMTHWLQARYVSTLLGIVCRGFGLHLQIEGEDQLTDGPLLVFVRHTSLLDVLLPGTLLSRRRDIQLRYILKRELLWDPCLDIAGHWLPNHFVRRDGGDTAKERDAIRQLKYGLSSKQGVLLYPEGTRFTAQKREKNLARLANAPDAFAEASRLKKMLPIRPGGALALLETEPACDVLFLAHHGFEGFATLQDFWKGIPYGRTLHVRFWHVPQQEIPTDGDKRHAWLVAEWQKMDDWLSLRQTT